MCVDLPSSENMDKAWRHKNQEIKFCIIDNQRSHVRTRYVYRKHKQMSRLTFLHPNLKNKLAKVVEFFFFVCLFSGCYGNWPTHGCSNPVLHVCFLPLILSTVTQSISATVIQHNRTGSLLCF